MLASSSRIALVLAPSSGLSPRCPSASLLRSVSFSPASTSAAPYSSRNIPSASTPRPPRQSYHPHATTQIVPSPNFVPLRPSSAHRLFTKSARSSWADQLISSNSTTGVFWDSVCASSTVSLIIRFAMLIDPFQCSQVGKHQDPTEMF